MSEKRPLSVRLGSLTSSDRKVAQHLHDTLAVKCKIYTPEEVRTFAISRGEHANPEVKQLSLTSLEVDPTLLDPAWDETDQPVELLAKQVIKEQYAGYWN